MKELVENAIDAGAGRIDVELTGKGDTISVTDDGCGMSPEDARRSFLRHSTSKLRDADDLFAIGTLGFRGEALSSIAAVARVELITRVNPAASPKAADGIGDAPAPPAHGVRIKVEGGEETLFEEAGCAPGTRTVVRDLFYNTPVRRKFLRSKSTELTHIVDAVTSLALSNAGTGLFLRSDGNELVMSPPVADDLANITNIYGAAFTRSLVPVDHEEGGVTIRGHVSKPQLTRGRSNHQFFSVNGRRVHNPALSRGLRDGYGPLLMKGRFPVAFLSIRLPPDQVDVNVHPTKREVRFCSESAMTSAVRGAVRGALEEADIIPRMEEGDLAPAQGADGPRGRCATRILLDHSLEGEGAPAAWAGEGGPDAAATESARADRAPDAGPAHAEDEGDVHTPEGARAGLQLSLDPGFPGPGGDGPAGAEAGGAAAQEPSPPAERTIEDGYPMTPAQHGKLVAGGITTLPFMKAVGQLHNCYIVAETAGGFFLIDQHAAHERINLDRLRRELSAGGTASQALLEPMVVELPPATVGALEERLEILRALGFDLEAFGRGAVKVSRVPALLRGRLEENDMAGALEELAGKGGRGADEGGIQEEVMHSIACRASIMAGETLDLPAMARLLMEMYHADEPLSCAHGRPTLLFMSQGELERRFRRTV